MSKALDPRPNLTHVDWVGRNSDYGWDQRGYLLSEQAVQEFPIIDWEKAAQAAHCFAIAAGLRHLKALRHD